jgi:hypothetical protein
MRYTLIFIWLAMFVCTAAASNLTPIEEQVLYALDQDEISTKVIERFRYNGEDWWAVARKVVSGDLKASDYQLSNAVYVLGKLGDPKAVPVLEKALSHADTKVRIGGLRALGRIPSPESSAVLNRFLEKKQLGRVEALAAVDAVAKAGSRGSIPTLNQLKSKPIYEGALKQQVDQAIKTLEKLPEEEQD